MSILWWIKNEKITMRRKTTPPYCNIGFKRVSRRFISSDARQTRNPKVLSFLSCTTSLTISTLYNLGFTWSGSIQRKLIWIWRFDLELGCLVKVLMNILGDYNFTTLREVMKDRQHSPILLGEFLLKHILTHSMIKFFKFLDNKPQSAKTRG